MRPTRDDVLKANRERREKELKARRLEDGFVEMRIPEADFPVLCKLYPGLEAHDHDEREAAWRDFRHSPIAKQYMVVATPREVQRKVRHGNKGVIVR